MRTFTFLRLFTLLILLLSFLVLLNGCASCRRKGHGLTINLFDTNGPGLAQKKEVETGDSLSVGLTGLDPGAAVQIYLNDDAGKEWSYARLFADQRGNVEPGLFWYQTGVIGTTTRQINFKPDPAFVTFEEAEAYFKAHPLRITVKDFKGNVLGTQVVPFRPRQSPMVYPSNKDGVLSNSYNLAQEGVYATGKNFPAGSTVQLFAVGNQYVWNAGDRLTDKSGKGGAPAIESVTLGPSQTSFTVKIWDHATGLPGSYDIVARIARDVGELALKQDDILSYGEDTGMILYVIINGNIVIDSAGRMRSAPAKFEFSDSFEKQENIFAAVDPSDVPAIHTGGNYAAYYVVNNQPASYWDGASPALTDVSGGIEIQRVKYWCINASRRLIWPNATQSEPIKDYDLVVDFGAVPAMDSASFMQDDVYNKGTDFLDGYDNAGFTVFEDPSSVGPFPVGNVELLQEGGISGITDPSGTTGPTQNVTLAWARIMYPASSAGTGTPVSTTLSNYPVALFLHGRHWNCDNDGSGPGLTGGHSFSCAPANRIPSHEGYNYIMERLASQGIFSISISAHDIQPGLGVWDYDARGRLILKFLDKLSMPFPSTGSTRWSRSRTRPASRPWTPSGDEYAPGGGGLLHVLFVVARRVYERLASGQMALGTVVLRGLEGDLTHACSGLLGGFTKSLAREIPSAFVKSIITDAADVDSGLGALDAEWAVGPRLGAVEVVVRQGTREEFRLRRMDGLSEPGEAWVGPDSVVVATGGGRGVTAVLLEEVVRRFGPTLVIVGRSDLTQHPPELLALSEEEFRKQEPEYYRAELLRDPSQKMTGLKRRLDACRGARELREGLDRLRALGGRVEYATLDVTDAERWTRWWRTSSHAMAASTSSFTAPRSNRRGAWRGRPWTSSPA